MTVRYLIAAITDATDDSARVGIVGVRIIGDSDGDDARVCGTDDDKDDDAVVDDDDDRDNVDQSSNDVVNDRIVVSPLRRSLPSCRLIVSCRSCRNDINDGDRDR